MPSPSGTAVAQPKLLYPDSCRSGSQVTVRIPLPNRIRGWDRSFPVPGRRAPEQARKTVPFCPHPHPTLARALVPQYSGPHPGTFRSPRPGRVCASRPAPPHALSGSPRRRWVWARGLRPRGLLTLLRTPQRSTGGPDSVSGSSSEPDEFQLWLSDMEARQPSRRPAPAPWAAPAEAPSPRGEASEDGEGRSARSGAGGSWRRDEVRPPRRRRAWHRADRGRRTSGEGSLPFQPSAAAAVVAVAVTPALCPALPPELSPLDANLGINEKGRKRGKQNLAAETQVHSHLRYRRHLPAWPTIYPPLPSPLPFVLPFSPSSPPRPPPNVWRDTPRLGVPSRNLPPALPGDAG